jgi:hypothetical protein
MTAKGDTNMSDNFGQVSGEVPNVNTDTIGQGSQQMDRIGNVVSTLTEDQVRDGSSKTELPTRYSDVP